MFIDDSVGPSNVAKEQLKRVRSKGATRGNVNVLVYIFVFFNTNWHILCCIILTCMYDLRFCSMPVNLGLDSMA